MSVGRDHGKNGIQETPAIRRGSILEMPENGGICKYWRGSPSDPTVAPCSPPMRSWKRGAPPQHLGIDCGCFRGRRCCRCLLPHPQHSLSTRLALPSPSACPALLSALPSSALPSPTQCFMLAYREAGVQCNTRGSPGGAHSDPPRCCGAPWIFKSANSGFANSEGFL